VLAVFSEQFCDGKDAIGGWDRNIFFRGSPFLNKTKQNKTEIKSDAVSDSVDLICCVCLFVSFLQFRRIQLQ
jgi:hypothetical protein